MVGISWIIEPFDRQRHDRAGFNCGVGRLDDWLITKLSQYEKRDLARAYVLVERGKSTVKGFYTLSNHTVVFDAFPEEQAKRLPCIDVPVVLIGRLAVDSSIHGQGLGEFLLLDALCRSEYLAARVGIQAVEVDAIDDRAKQFYKRYGFIAFKDDSRHLFLPMKVIRKLKLPPL